MKIRCQYWQEDGMWLGYLAEFPDYWTQGISLEDLEEHLKDLSSELTSGAVLSSSEPRP
jgi:predicted RNase H-like HicB family nuclease